jgi:hypothetical protein
MKEIRRETEKKGTCITSHGVAVMPHTYTPISNVSEDTASLP